MNRTSRFRRLPLIRTLALALLAAHFVLGQADTPPERESAAAPDKLPKLDVPAPAMKGKLTVQFSGASAFTEKQLRTAIARQLATIEESGLDAANAYDAAFFLENHYRKQGYSQVSATGQIAGAGTLRLTVREGPQTIIGSVAVPGAKSHTADEVTNYLLGPTRERFPRTKKDTALPFVEADVQSGAALVTRLYAAEGFLDAVIEQPQFALSADKRTAALTLNIEEGPQYWFGPITFIGPPTYPREELAKAMSEDTGKPFTTGRIEAARRKLEDFYKKRGHFLAQVTATGDKEASRQSRVPVAFTVAPGAVHHFDGAVLRGLEKVSPKFVQNRLMKLRGQTYDPELIDERFRELIQTGLFKNLRINPQLAPGNEVKLDVEVEEAKAKEFGIGLGFASYEGAIASLTYTDRNFLRAARPLSFGIEYTSRGYKGEVLWSDPWFFESDYRFRARLYATTRTEEGYSKNEFGLQPSLARNITKHWEVSAFLLAKQVKITDSTILPRSLLGAEKYLANSIGLSSTLDYRNNPANPTRGFIGTVTFDAASGALGSEVEFLRGTARFSYYLPVTAKSGLAFGARGGVVAPMGRTKSGNLPIDERFFSGGSASVRSFAERQLGPKDRNRRPIGGEAFTVFNVEYTFPIYGDLKGAVFADAGNVRPRAADFGLGDLRYGVGAGLRYNLPFGPIRLDYGLNPSPRPDEDRGAFHFSIGVAF